MHIFVGVEPVSPHFNLICLDNSHLTRRFRLTIRPRLEHDGTNW